VPGSPGGAPGQDVRPTNSSRQPANCAALLPSMPLPGWLPCRNQRCILTAAVTLPCVAFAGHAALLGPAACKDFPLAGVSVLLAGQEAECRYRRLCQAADRLAGPAGELAPGDAPGLNPDTRCGRGPLPNGPWCSVGTASLRRRNSSAALLSSPARSRISGLAGGGSSPIPIAPASSASAASSRAGSPPRSSTMGWPVTPRSSSLARQMTPAGAAARCRCAGSTPI
jgi:hypothetical protein